MGNPIGIIFLIGTGMEWYYLMGMYPLPSLLGLHFPLSKALSSRAALYGAWASFFKPCSFALVSEGIKGILNPSLVKLGRDFIPSNPLRSRCNQISPQLGRIS
jgi:hypothetical protein